MASGTDSDKAWIDTGHSRLYIDTDYKGYNQAGNYSTLDIQLYSVDTENWGPAFSNAPTGFKIMSPNFTDISGSKASYNAARGGTVTWYSGTINVTHDANGYLTLKISGHIDYSGTSTFGGPADTPQLSRVLARIPKAPGKSPKPVVKSVTSSSVSFYMDEPDNENGADVTVYQYQVDNNSDFSSPFADESGNEIDGRDFSTVSGLTPPGSVWYVRQRWQNVGGWGPWSDALTVTLGIVAPSAPSTPTIARVSDTKQTVSWNRVASTSAPYSSQQVQRREYSNGAWSAWTSIATVATAYTTAGANSISDTGTVANRQYQYRVKATNGSGEAYSGGSGSVFTTPTAPSSLVAEKQADSSIILTLTQAVPHSSYKTTLQYSLNAGGSWTALTVLNNGVLTYQWTPPAGSSVVFQARVAVDSAGSVGDALTSTWRQSNTVGLTAPPSAPSALSPNGPAFDAGTIQEFTWKHNTVDSSAQSAYELHYRIGAAGWTTTGKVASSIAKLTFPADTFVNGNDYQWEVRTWGADATASPWSSTATFTASAPPSVTITAPDVILDTSTLVLSWSYYDPEGSAQSQWAAQLLLLDEVVESKSGSGPASSVEFATRLADDTEYQVMVQVRDGDSLWSEWDQVTFTTSFLTPPIPFLALSWGEDTGSVAATVNNSTGDIDPISNVILRSLDGGESWEEVGVAPVDGIGFDSTVPLGMPSVLYKVIAWTSLPSSAESEVQEISTVGIVGYWSVGEMFENVIQLRVNQGGPPRIDLKTGVFQKVLHYYAGRTSPVETMGEATAVTGDVEFVVTTVQDRDQARIMAKMPAPHLLRLPDGTTVFASLGPVSEKRLAPGWYRIGFGITEVDR